MRRVFVVFHPDNHENGNAVLRVPMAYLFSFQGSWVLPHRRNLLEIVLKS